ncbi:hypothetical protein V3481_018642 [Fusarium oxysporum f. sp. vasinfectum]|uniref:BZIP domain-containing protein n=1 Tax=Fusarium oxysporum f. sp. vasinfectum 25433 TaxID=1089449 RepID=X0M1H8_FUSOX|nr:hypothetical protein FOTG_17054 [Fusarium oxysporum f. sp. vasinfectum 25433]
MGGDSTFATSYTPETPLWDQWWPSNQLVPFGSSEDKRSTASDVYTLTGPLINSSLHGYNTDLTHHRYSISHEINYMNAGNDLNPVVEDIPLIPVPEHGISKGSPGQGHWHSPSPQRTPDRKTYCYSDNLKSRKPSNRVPLGERDINPQTMEKGKYSPVRRTNHTSSNSTHPAQQGNDRMKRIRERNRIASNKLRFKHREEQQGLECIKQDLERINRDLSTCVADLTFEVYELKMQLLQQSGCNCTLMQNYLIHESSRYIQALEEKSQQEASHRRL